jgi:hypothetical protein
MNLLKETLELLESNNKKETDVEWVGTTTHKTTWEAFKSKADTEYDGGFGSPKVAQDLLIVGENWWMERHEYDGSEWWEFKEIPIEPKEIIELKALTVIQADELEYDVSCGWENLLAINGVSENGL